jgi:hypothetical protein
MCNCQQVLPCGIMACTVTVTLMAMIRLYCTVLPLTVMVG